MASVALNRTLIVLGYVGLFISGFLSLGHLLKVSLPCGITGGCDAVATHDTSFIVGNMREGGFPVAYVGFIGYVLLTVLAIIIAVKGPAKARGLTLIGFFGSAVGTLYSFYLTYISITEIKAICPWCISSAITMVLTTVCYAALLQTTPAEDTRPNRLDPMLAGVLTLIVGFGLAAGGVTLKGGGQPLDGGVIERANKLELVGKNSHILGNPDAPVTIIEFADLLCPSCQQTFPVLEDLVKNSNGKIRLVFHHFPLFMKDDHKMALPAATIAEMAGEQDKFWPFIAAIYGKSQAELQSTEALLEVAKSLGLEADKIQKRMADPEDPAIKRVTDDLNLANEIKISSTPTLFIQAKGGQVEPIVAASRLEAKLNQEPYLSLIKGGGSGQ